MNAHAAARLAARLASAATREHLGAVLVEELVRGSGADGSVAWLPADPDGPVVSSDVFAAGSLVPSIDRDLVEALSAERVDEWLAARGAEVCRGVNLPLSSAGRIVTAWRNPARVPLQMSSVLELVAQHVAGLGERQQLEHRLETMTAALHDAEQQIARTRRVRAIGDMASGVAHDFNNCLTSILGFAELALGDLHEGDPFFNDLNGIRTVALDAASLVRRLQSFGRNGRDANERTVADLGDIARAMPDLARPRWTRLTQCEGITFDVTVDAQPVPPVHVIVAEIRELLLNLMFNAVDAMPRGGRMTISTREVDGWAEIAVADQGHGMSPDVQARMFEPFFSTKDDRGSGLGLSVCRTIADRHGATLDVRTAVGRGTTIALRLPPAAMELLAPTGPRSGRPATPGGGGRRVLLVDDQEEVRGSVGEMLRALGHTVVVAEGGEQALALVDTHRPEVVVTDYGMPGLNGLDIAGRLRIVAPHTPIVLLTGWAIDADADMPDNIVRVLGKPVTMKALGEALATCRATDRPADGRSVKCS